MPDETQDPEDDSARLAQEATNQSTPDKALADAEAKKARRMKIPPKRTHPPESD